MKTFTKHKFLRLPKEQRHKKCFELLRIIYEQLLSKKEIKTLLSSYEEMLHWMQLPKLQDLSLKKISDQYHYHLKEADMNLKEHNLLPSIRTKDATAKEDFAKNAIYLDHVRSAYNVGSIVRTTEALRIGSLYFSSNTPFIDNKKVQKIAMGTANIVPCNNMTSLKDLPSPVIALETSDQAINIFEFIFPKTFTLILGNEEYGISDEALQLVDYIIEIPMLGAKNSINVACAYAICAAQIKRQQ